MKAILGYAISFGAIILVFAVINLVLVGGQKLWHHGDQVKLDTLKTELEVQKSDLDQREAELKTLGSSIDQYAAQIADLKSKAQAIEQQNPSGIPPDIYDSYKQLIDQCNSDVAKYNSGLDRSDALFQDYSQRIDRYNALIKESNDLSNQIGATWYIVPIPAPRFSHERTPEREGQ
jgi:cell division protein FtsB